MRRSTFGTKAISLFLNICLVLGPLLYARDASYADDGFSWSGEIEPMVMRAYGYSPEVLRIWEVYIPEGDSESPDFDVTSVDNDLRNWKFAFRGEAEGMKNRWGFGVAGFQFDTGAKVERNTNAIEAFPSGPGSEPGDLGAYGYVSGPLTTGFVAFEGEGIFFGTAALRNGDGPIYGILDEGDGEEYTELDFSARTNLDVWSTDIYGFHRLIDKETVNLDLRLGAKLGSLDVGTKTDHSLAPCGDSCHVGMKLDTSVDSKVLAGPYLAASGTARFGRVRVEAQLAQSVLFGDVDYQTRVKSYWEDAGPDTGSYSRSVVNRSKSVTMPVTEADLKVLYDLNAFFSAGIGMYAGVWWNAAVPTNSTPGTVESDGPPFDLFFDPTSADTGLDKEHITFMGVMATLEMRFFGP